jgi:hypothetical protein
MAAKRKMTKSSRSRGSRPATKSREEVLSYIRERKREAQAASKISGDLLKFRVNARA